MTCMGGNPRKGVSRKSSVEQTRLQEEFRIPTSNYTFKELLTSIGRALMGDSEFRLYLNWKSLDSKDCLFWQIRVPDLLMLLGPTGFSPPFWNVSLNSGSNLSNSLLSTSPADIGAVTWSLSLHFSFFWSLCPIGDLCRSLLYPV